MKPNDFLRHPNPPLDNPTATSCQIAVQFGGKTPGDVLAFAQNMAIEKHYMANADWLVAVKMVAQRHRIVAAKAS
jgi:hypothetical protein